MSLEIWQNNIFRKTHELLNARNSVDISRLVDEGIERANSTKRPFKQPEIRKRIKRELLYIGRG